MSLPPPTLTFLGAVGTVTGSRYLLEVSGRRYLIECGLFQGPEAVERRNWEPFPVDARSLNAVVLSHAHIDHCGYLPRLTALGLQAPVFCTAGTALLLGILLPDAARIQEEDARFATAHADREGIGPTDPLYTEEDARRALARLRPTAADAWVAIDDLVSLRFRRAGHILGSAIIELRVETGDGPQTLVFSGDLGGYERDVMRDPEAVERADVLVVESTYGDRTQDRSDLRQELAAIVNETAGRGGVLVIPAFAVGRTQDILYLLSELEEAGRIPSLPVFVDSPMATDATEIYCLHHADHNLRVDLLMDERQCPLRCWDTRFVRTPDESKALNRRPGPFIVISASGMCSGGRVMHHLKHRLSDGANTVLLVGYQAVGTTGRLLDEGAQSVRIHGRTIPVRARIEMLHGLSAHADRDELHRWLSGFVRPPRATFVVHGEPSAATALADTLEDWGWRVSVPETGRAYPIGEAR